jgi:hypothetical protein
MAEVPDQRVKVSVEESQFLGGTTESFTERYAAAINWIVKNVLPQGPGSVIYSKMSLAQFQAVKGVGWVLANGANVSGSLYHTVTGRTNIPDIRGVFIRGLNNGRSDGKQNPDATALNGLQLDGTKAHTHSTINSTNYAASRNLGGGAAGAVRRAVFSTAVTVNVGTSVPGGAEMYPKHVVMNAFIRIN